MTEKEELAEKEGSKEIVGSKVQVVADDLVNPIELGEPISDPTAPPAFDDSRTIKNCVFPHKKQAQQVTNYAEIEVEATAIKDFILRINKNGYHGLSALAIAQPQVNSETPKRFFVDKDLNVYYNVMITEKTNKIVSKEQCLSWPFRDKKKVTRYNNITATYYDENDDPQEVQLEGLQAVIFQHEVDHFNGIMLY